MADNNAGGHVDLLIHLFESDYPELWRELNCPRFQFADVGLSAESADDAVWTSCQANEVVLITNNRNADGPNSLEAVMRNDPSSNALPVITIADGERFLKDRGYSDRAAEKALQFLLEIDKLRGTGRLFIP